MDWDEMDWDEKAVVFFVVVAVCVIVWAIISIPAWLWLLLIPVGIVIVVLVVWRRCETNKERREAKTYERKKEEQRKIERQQREAEESKRREEAARKQREREAEEERRQEEERRKRLEEFRCNLIENWSCDVSVIDSRVWLDEHYAPLLVAVQHALAGSGRTHVMYDVQFNEICEIAHQCVDKQAQDLYASWLIHHIEEMMAKGCLRIKKLPREQVPLYLSGVPVGIRVLLCLSASGKRVVFISDDTELRIRARQIIDETGVTNFTVTEAAKMIEMAVECCETDGLAYPWQTENTA